MRTVLITGATGGIGRACAVKFAAEGYAVAINYAHNEEKASRLLAEITEMGGIAAIFKADVSKLGEVKFLMREVVKTFGGIDVLINNAGIVEDEYLLMMSEGTVDGCIDLNVKGYLYCAQQAALKMMRKKSGTIINMSSVSAIHALPGQAVYAATKGAVNSLTAVLAKELADRGIRVNAVAPGFVETEMLDKVPENKKTEYLNYIPQHRFASPCEIAEAVYLLCGDSLKYMTGQVIVLDGGLSL